MAVIIQSSASTSTSLTAPYTVAAGTTKLVVVLGFSNIRSITSFQWDSDAAAAQAMTLATSVRGGQTPSAYMYYLDDPVVGDGDVIISLSGAASSVMVTMFGLAQVKPGAPLDTATSNPGSVSSISVNVTGSPGGIAIDALIADSSTTVTAGAGQTQISNFTNLRRQATSYEVGDGTRTMSWSITSSTTCGLCAASWEQFGAAGNSQVLLML